MKSQLAAHRCTRGRSLFDSRTRIVTRGGHGNGLPLIFILEPKIGPKVTFSAKVWYTIRSPPRSRTRLYRPNRPVW